MRIGFQVISLMLLAAGMLPAQDVAPGPDGQGTPQKRNWMNRVIHPFSSSPRLPQYKDPRIRGLELQLQLSPQPIKLSETRQMEVKLLVTNRGKRAVELNFPTDQRIEIYLRNSAETVLTKWSDNHAVSEKPETVLINPDEHVEYVQPIATRELTPDKVFTVEVFLPNYPELRIRQKFLTQQ
jgi:intracellular proteinase inhibitor BsuPI